MLEQYLAWIAVLVAATIAVGCFRWAVVRCDRANVADWGNKWLNRLDGLNRIFCQRFHRLQADVIQLPASGGALLAANHISGLDPLLMIASCSRPLRFMIATEEYNRWWLTWLFKIIGCIPVDRTGQPEKAFQAALRALDVGEVIGVFPQGRIQAPGDAPVPLKRGVVALASLADVPIFPLHISGVRGAGHILLAIFLRSRARIKATQAIDVSDTKDEAALLELSEFVNTGAADG